MLAKSKAIGTCVADFMMQMGHVSLARRTVLDVGTASGFRSFEAERNGAIVTSFDADSPSRYEYVFGETSQYVDDLAFERRRN